MRLLFIVSVTIEILFLTVHVSGAEGPEPIAFPFSSFDANEQEALNKINKKLSGFSEGCSIESDAAGRSLFKMLLDSAACGTNVAKAYVTRSTSDFSSAVISCGRVTLSFEERKVALEGLNACKEMEELWGDYEKQCKDKGVVLFFHETSAYCFNREKKLKVIVDFEKKEVRVWK